MIRTKLLRLLAGLTVCAANANVHAAAAPELTQGSLSLHLCNSRYGGGYCGSIEQPLDPRGIIPGSITIGFEWYPHFDTALPSAGVVLAQEGGPGYSTTGSRDGYLRILEPLRGQRDVLLIDKRGTGRSDPIDCPALQKSPSEEAIAACGAQLGRAAWLYGSAFAANDVAAVLDALDTGIVDYYGDSYGTYFGQIFAALYPQRLRTLVLDSAYPVLGGGDDWNQYETRLGPASLDTVCARSPSCAALGGSSRARLETLLTRLRAAPVSGKAPGIDGEPRSVTADARTLFLIFYSAGDSIFAYRDIDAAGRALLDHDDPLPLLRLVAESIELNQLGGPARQFSVGLADAVTCSDYPQHFDLRAPPELRRQQFAQAIANLKLERPRIFTPFTIDDVVNAPDDPEFFQTCITWPAPPEGLKPGSPIPGNTSFSNVPTLVLNGEFDTVTAPKSGANAAKLFPNARYIVVPNGIHETAIGDAGVYVPPNGADLSQCVAPIVAAFIGSGGDPGDTSCLDSIRPIRTVPAFAQHYADLAPAEALDGNEASADGLRLASAATESIGDVLARYTLTLAGKGAGLRGGRWHLDSTAVGYSFSLKELRWTEDLSSRGKIQWNQLSGEINADIDVRSAGQRGRIKLHWNDRETNALVTLDGRLDGRALHATRIAP